MRISDWSSGVCSSDLGALERDRELGGIDRAQHAAEALLVEVAQIFEDEHFFLDRLGEDAVVLLARTERAFVELLRHLLPDLGDVARAADRLLGDALAVDICARKPRFEIFALRSGA